MNAFRRRKFNYSMYNDFSLLFHGKREGRTDAIKIFSSMVNVGVLPKFDSVAPLEIKSKIRGAIPFDLDLIIEEMNSSKKPPTPGTFAVRLLELTQKITLSVKERERLFGVCLGSLESEEVKRFMKSFKQSLIHDEVEMDFSGIFPNG